MEKKYELTEETLVVGGHILHRIMALKDFRESSERVKKGDLGGFIEKESNLDHYGNCWIYNEAVVYGDAKIRDKHGFRGEYFLYTMLTDNFEESFARVNHWRQRLLESRSDSSASNINAYAQPFRNPYKRDIPPQWQKDIANWVNQKPVFVAVEFKDYEPRKGFRCAQYFY